MVHQPQPCRIVSSNKRVARCSTSHTQQATKRTARNVANGFLKAQFLPLRSNRYNELENRNKVEKGFFNSLKNLASLYQFEPLTKSNAVYPCNISNAYRHAAQQIARHCKDTSLAIISDSTHFATLATYKEYSVGHTLYYIPVHRLLNVIQDERRTNQSGLLQSVFAYLFKVVGIPMYTERESYLRYQYEMIYEWYSTDEDMKPQDYGELKREFKMMLYAGKSLQRSLSSSYHLVAFEKRLKDFEPDNKVETELKNLATGFYKLYRDYRKESILNCVKAGFDSPETEDRVTVPQYLSIIYDLDSDIAHDLFNGINAELQECSVMDNPVAVQLFDKPQYSIEMNLDFPQKLFALLDDLCDLLKLL